MGADFLLAICPFPTGLTRAQVMARIDHLNGAPMQDLLDNFDHYIVHSNPETPEQQMRAILKTATQTYIYDGTRDVAHISLDGRSYVMTGGMSWGDNPTEAFDYIAMLTISEVTKPIGG